MIKFFKKYRPSLFGYLFSLAIILISILDHGLMGGFWSIILVLFLYCMGILMRMIELPPIDYIDIVVTSVKRDEEDNHDW